MPVEVGSAIGYLDLDINGFVSGLRSAQSEAETKGKGIASALSSGLQSVGGALTSAGQTMTAGLTVPIVTGVTAAVKQFANLEQSIGGVETLFKGSAQTVITNAEKAYVTAGVDANSYMEQVTSFSATLLQGLGGDTAAAAKYADEAITDMSDNANKMGTDMGLIQNAYQGFAKDNYTMLDNLKLGYGGTQTEMARLINDSGVLGDGMVATADNVKDIPFDQVIEAIHKIQENLGITGTTAEEAAGTVSGSFGMAKSSVLNFLQQLGNPGADMQQFSKAMIDSIGVFVDNVKRVLLTIWDNLPISPLQKKMIVAAAAFGPLLLAVGKVVTVIGGVIGAISKIGGVISGASKAFATFNSGVKLASAGSKLFSGSILGIAAPIVAIVAAIGILVGAFVTLWQNNEDFRNKITQIWNKIQTSISGFIGAIESRMDGIKEAFNNIINFITPIWQGFCDWIAPLFTGAFQIISDVLSTIFGVIIGIVDVFIGVFTGDWQGAWDGVKNIFSTIWEGIKNVLSTLVSTIVTLLGTLITSIGTWVVELWGKAKEAGKGFLDNIVSFFKELPGKIATLIGNALAKIVEWKNNMTNKAKETGSNFLDKIVTFFKELPGNVGRLIGLVLGNIIKWSVNMVTKANEMGKQFIENVITFFKELPGKIATWLANTISNVKEWATTMAGKAKEAGTNFIENVITFIKELPGKVGEWLTNTINKLKEWIPDMAQKGKDAITGLIQNIIDGAKEIPTKMLDIGKNIVDGVWNGIKNAKDNFVNNIKDFFGGIVDGAKEALGIHSPSKVFKDQVGKNIALGVISGINSKKKDAKKTAAQLAQDMVDAAEKKWSRYNITHSTTLANEAAFWKKIKDTCKKGSDAYYTALEKYETANSQLKQSVKDLESDYKNSWKNIKDNLAADIQDVVDSYNNALESRVSELKSQAGGLFSAYEKKETEDTTKTLKQNLKSQVEALNEYNKEMTNLAGRKGVTDEFLEEIQGMGLDATEQVKLLNTMTEKELADYVKLWKQKNDAASKIAKSELSDYEKECQKQVEVLTKSANKELNELEKTYANSLKELGVTTKDQSKDIGKNIVKGLQNGIKSEDKDFKKYLKTFFKSITTTAKDSLGIHSPSKVFADQVGKWLPAGMADGFVSAMPKAIKEIGKSLDDGIDDVNSNEVELDGIEVFVNILKSLYENFALFFESIEERMGKSIVSMTKDIERLLAAGKELVTDSRSIDYIDYSQFIKSKIPVYDGPTDNMRGANSSGDTYYQFYSQAKLSEVECRHEMIQAQKEMALDF